MKSEKQWNQKVFYITLLYGLVKIKKGNGSMGQWVNVDDG